MEPSLRVSTHTSLSIQSIVTLAYEDCSQIAVRRAHRTSPPPRPFANWRTQHLGPPCTAFHGVARHPRVHSRFPSSSQAKESSSRRPVAFSPSSLALISARAYCWNTRKSESAPCRSRKTSWNADKSADARGGPDLSLRFPPLTVHARGLTLRERRLSFLLWLEIGGEGNSGERIY